MTVTIKSRRFADTVRRPARGLAAVALLALAPKCLLCVAAYAGIGAALGLGGREICGAPARSPGDLASWIPLAGAILGFIGFLASRRDR